MNIKNTVGLDTEKGFKTIELAQGDLMLLNQNIDVLVFSAYENSYDPITGTLIESIEKAFNINILDISKKPYIDLRASFQSWIHPLEENKSNFKYLLCVETRKSNGRKGADYAKKMIEGLFIMLSVLEAKEINISSIALPLLGSGSQKINASLTIKEIIDQSYKFFQKSETLNKIFIVERNENYANQLSLYMDEHLGRNNTIIPSSSILKAIKHELYIVIDNIIEKKQNNRSQKQLVDILTELKQNLSQSETNATLIGISGRKVVEIITTNLHERHKTGFQHNNLYDKIINLYELRIAQWIQSYMHILRIIGNESAHFIDNKKRKPLNLYPSDLTISLFCLKRVLDFWSEWE